MAVARKQFGNPGMRTSAIGRWYQRTGEDSTLGMGRRSACIANWRLNWQQHHREWTVIKNCDKIIPKIIPVTNQNPRLFISHAIY
jgi:hypothetical protein